MNKYFDQLITEQFRPWNFREKNSNSHFNKTVAKIKVVHLRGERVFQDKNRELELPIFRKRGHEVNVKYLLNAIR